jgi:hypothetical protein
MATKNKVFWITNLSNRNVTLSDLYISVPAGTSINLLDNRHYQFTLDQLLKSAKEGSIFKKRDKIVVRKVPPQVFDKQAISVYREAAIPSRSPSIYEIKHENYEELNIADDELIEGSKLNVDNLPPSNNGK